VKTLQAKVISDKMEKSAVVVVTRAWTHPLYKKTVIRSKKYLVHNELKAKTGDTVTIKESRPISKNKTWKIIEVLNKKEKN